MKSNRVSFIIVGVCDVLQLAFVIWTSQPLFSEGWAVVDPMVV
jgi:hypothetical protein